MKINIAPLMIAGSCFLTAQSNAGDQTAIITWTGDAGYCTRISMTYDPSLAYSFAKGDLTFQGPTNQGITSLVVSFFSPSASLLQPLYSVTDVSNSVALYRYLNISFDTTASSLFGSIDVGKDTFGEGLPGSSAGEYYLHGVATAPTLIDASSGLQLDAGGSFSVTIVPEPATWKLLGVAGLVVLAARLRGRPNTSPAPTAVGAVSSAVAVHAPSRRWLSFLR